MTYQEVISLLESIKDFRINDELPFNTVDYMNIDDAIDFLQKEGKPEEQSEREE